MAYFTKSPEKQMQADITARVAERDALIARLAAAEDAVVAETSKTMELAVAGADDNQLDKAEGKVTAARERVSTLKAALGRLGATIIGLENAYAEHKDKTTRRQTALQCEKLADDLEEVGRDINLPLQRMVAITAVAAAGQIWDAAGLHSYAEQSQMQIPAAIAAVSLALRQHGTRVMAKMERATLLQAEAPHKMVTVAEPKVERVFTLQNVSWTVDGQIKTINKFVDVDLPVETARRALASRACAPIDSDARRQWAGTRPITHPDASECVSLDGAEIVKLDDAVVDGTFVRLDRGPAYQVQFRKA